MIYGMRQLWRYLAGTDIAGRGLAVRPDDTFLVSYPRSGNTWTRFLIANLLHPDQPATFANIERMVPDTEAQSSRRLKRIPGPRFIKSHEYFDHRYPRVIYIVRDPRDVALSYYDFQRKYQQLEDNYPLEQYVSDFVNGRLISADWGTWAENVASWIATRRNRKNFLLLRYEDMVSDTAGELLRIADFLELRASPRQLDQVIERSSAERMRELEKLQSDQWVSTKNKRKDIPFVRTALAGGWKTKLPAASVVEIESAWGPLMRFLNYELVTHEGLLATQDAKELYAR
jgi:Sulfotransferase domain